MVIILGLGFTGARLAGRLLRRGMNVSAPVRGIQRFGELAQAGLQLSEFTLAHPETMLLPRDAIMAVLIPPLPEPENSELRETIREIAPKRVVYVSSTGVYGDQIDVDWNTPAAPNDDRGRVRLAEERWIASGPWTSLILRAAAIYGPGRGVQAAIREGKMPRGAGSGIVSRIHADDLASIIEAGLFANLQGAWPVADDAPCSTTEIAAWCIKSGYAELPQLKEVSEHRLPRRPIPGRNVDGRKIREMLGVELKYPSWQTGIAASLAEELPQKLAKRLEAR
jgi:nucleoside-diphosphate-sugar epimerase